MLIDLRLEGQDSVFFGGGRTAERKIKKFVAHGALVTVYSRGFTKGLEDLCSNGKVKLVKTNLLTGSTEIKSIISGADIVVSATDDQKLNAEVSRAARDAGVLMSAVDMPSHSDFYFPAVAQTGSIRIGVCTDGKSPLMSGLLRRRIEGVITEEDALQVELQHYARGIAKELVPEVERRREFLHGIAEDRGMRLLLLDGRLEEAKRLVKETIERI